MTAPRAEPRIAAFGMVSMADYDEVAEWASRRAVKLRRRAEQVNDLWDALRDLVDRCDGPEGVRADGTNIDTLRAHAALGDQRREEP